MVNEAIFQLSTATETPVVVCEERSDLVYVLDEAFVYRQPLQAAHDALELYFRNALAGLDVGATGTHVSVYTIGNDVVTPLLMYDPERAGSAPDRIVEDIVDEIERLASVRTRAESLNDHINTTAVLLDTLSKVGGGEDHKQVVSVSTPT